MLRSGTKEFQEAHIQRDELAAADVLKYIISTEDMWETMLEMSPIGWFIDAVGFLMLAVMPRRDEEDTTERLNIAQNCWSPTNAALAYAQSKNRTPWVIDTVSRRRYGTTKTTVPKCHVPIAADSDLGNRKTLLERLKAEAKEREKASTVPKDIVDAFWVSFNQAEADAKVTDEYDWLPNFNFEIRGWKSKANQGHSGTAPASPAADYNGPAPQQYTAGEESLTEALQGLGISEAPGPASPPPGEGATTPPAPGPTGQQSGSPPQPPHPAGQSPGTSQQPPSPEGRPAGGAKSVRRSVPDQPWQATYYTIGQVGNHRFRTDLWALVDDGSSGFDIYDVTGMFPALAIGTHLVRPETISRLDVY